MIETASNAEMMDLFGVSDRTVAKHGSSGIFVRVGRGRYDVKASIRAYAEHLRKAAAGRLTTSEELKLEQKRCAAAQADLKEMERDAKRRVMVDVREFEERWGRETVLFRQAMMGVPAAIASALTGISRHDATVMEDIMRDALERSAEEVIAQERRDEAKAEDDLRPRRGKRRT